MADYSGEMMAFPGNGDIVAIGSILNDEKGTSSGHVRVFKWDDIGLAWKQMGTDLDGKGLDDLFGQSIALSSDGTTLAVGRNWYARAAKGME